MVIASHRDGMVGSLWPGIPANAPEPTYETMQYQNT
ncbi:hypothetical protein BH24ACT19_BH24ACT19_08910 [soil metagenome]